MMRCCVNDCPVARMLLQQLQSGVMTTAMCLKTGKVIQLLCFILYTLWPTAIGVWL